MSSNNHGLEDYVRHIQRARLDQIITICRETEALCREQFPNINTEQPDEYAVTLMATRSDALVLLNTCVEYVKVLDNERLLPSLFDNVSESYADLSAEIVYLFGLNGSGADAAVDAAL